MNKLTAIILTKNEEAHIDRCLSHLDQYVDSIVVVDNGSTDNTMEIVKSYDKVKEYCIYPNEFHDALLRNIGLLLARKTDPDWILRIDADERFEDFIIDRLNFLLNQDFCTQWTFRWIHWYDKDYIRLDGEFGKRLLKGALFRIKKPPYHELPYLMYFSWKDHHSGIKYFSWNKKEASFLKEFLSDVVLYHYGYMKGHNRNTEKVKLEGDDIILIRYPKNIDRFKFMKVSDYLKSIGIEDEEIWRR